MNSAPYPPEIATLIENASVCPLGPGTPVKAAYEPLRSLTADSLSTRPVQDREMAEACLSGLWLLYNYLDQSHTISQNLPSSSGSYWHGIMHRREPDYPNAKYWFRRTGHHPAMAALATEATALAAGTQLDRYTQFLSAPDWDAMAMVDACQAAETGQCGQVELLQHVAQAEWTLLFQDCYARAF